MLKKLNQKLISTYPLLWNTKVLQVMCATLITHLLFYIAGFAVPIGIKELYIDYYFGIEEVITFSVLVSTLIIILWLAFYLRNNPFKSYYTLGKHYLFYEFLIVLFIFFSTSTFFFTYQQGLYDNVKLKTLDIDLQEDAETINLAHHFIAFSKNDFDIRYCCDSLEAQRIRDSIRAEYEKAHPNTNNADTEYERHYREDDDTIEYEKSYLYYCSQVVNLYPQYRLRTREELNDVATSWLKGHRKDSVLALLKQYKALCSKYGVSNYFDPVEHVNEVFNDNRFTVRRVIDTYRDDEVYYSRAYYYINKDNLTDAIYTIERVRMGFWNIKILLVMLYYALGASILLFSFRITRLRHWLLGIVGMILWCILFTLFGVLSRIEENVLAVIILVWLAMLILSVINIANKQYKLFAGIAFNWVLWVAPFVIPFVFVLISEYTRVRCYDYNAEGYPCPPQSPTYIWINNHWDVINGVNIGFLILIIWLFFIPLAKKWQANPEE